MGSAFVGYGVLMLTMMEFGKHWLHSRQISQEFLDCCVITAWGVVNTFTYVGPSHFVQMKISLIRRIQANQKGFFFFSFMVEIIYVVSMVSSFPLGRTGHTKTSSTPFWE
jgi:hypothetical protein